MFRNLTFGQKLGGGFALTVLCTLVISAVAVHTLDLVVQSKDQVIAGDAASLIDAARVTGALEARSASLRAYLLLKEDRFLDQMRTAREDGLAAIERLKARAVTPADRQGIDEISRLEAAWHGTLEQIVAQRKTAAAVDVISRQFEEVVLPRRIEMDRALSRLVTQEEKQLEDAKVSSTAMVRSVSTTLIGITALCVLLASGSAFFLSRALTTQIGAAIHHIQSSSTELQTAAGQQASGSREHAAALSEITTTIRELLSTSQQIADGAQRVARIAERTASDARTGDATVQRAQEALATSKGQVDLIVSHMLELGRKSQQVGGVLDIVNELADQTNILAINATIEAAGAGEAGRRFGVVADEIRKLADRVGRSTKEIRGLVEEIRSAVNTTVMTTEGGAKAVDAGTRQFGDVITAFRQIVSQVQITTDAAREIELSTKQQSTAVDQVNLAVGQAAQAARESEVSAGQTLQTASDLAGLSRDLATLVQSTPAS